MKKALAAALMLFASASAWAAPLSLGLPIPDDMNTLFGLPIGIIIFLLIFLITDKDSASTQRTFIISAIVGKIIAGIVFIACAIVIPQGVGVLIGAIAIIFLLPWIAAVSLIIGTVVSALTTWSRGSEPPPPPQKATFTLKKPPADENDKESKESDNEK